MNITNAIVPAAQQATVGLLSQPILLAAIITFSGVLLTVIVGTTANFRLARRRNAFEEALARQKFEYDKELSQQKLRDDALARRESIAAAARTKQIDF